MKRFLLALVVFASLASAASVKVVAPVEQMMQGGDSVDLGLVGPGQTFEVDASRATGVPASVAAVPNEALWDKLFVGILPDGWLGSDSKFYEEPMRAFITVAFNTPDGNYNFKLRTLDEYEGTPSTEFNAKITVSKDVLELAVLEKKITAGVGQPAVYFIRLKNKSSASDSFDLTASGLPATWKYSKRVFVPLKSEVVVPFEVLSTDQGEFTITFDGVSMSSDEIRATDTAQLITQSSLLLDMQAASRGVLIFPGIEQTIYSLIAFVGTLL